MVSWFHHTEHWNLQTKSNITGNCVARCKPIYNIDRQRWPDLLCTCVEVRQGEPVTYDNYVVTGFFVTEVVIHLFLRSVPYRNPGLADKNRNDHSIYIVCWKIWRHVFIPWVMINISVQVIFSNSYFAILHIGADCIYVHYSEWKRSGIVNFINTWMTWGLF